MLYRYKNNIQLDIYEYTINDINPIILYSSDFINIALNKSRRILRNGEWADFIDPIFD